MHGVLCEAHAERHIARRLKLFSAQWCCFLVSNDARQRCTTAQLCHIECCDVTWARWPTERESMKQKANSQLSKGNALKTEVVVEEKGSMRFVIRDRASGVTHERWPHPTTSGPSCAVSRIMRESSGSMRATTSGCEAERSTRSAGSCERR